MNRENSKKTVCMIVPEVKVRGGIAAVTAGYRGSRLESENRIIYVESYCDGSKFKKFAKALKAYASFIHILNSEKIDIVHIHSAFGPSFYRKLPFINIAYHRHIPVVNHIHGSALDEFYVQASESKKKLVRKIYNRCSALIALSAQWKERLSEIVPPEKITVIPNYSVIHQKINKSSSDGTVNILYLGVLTHAKGVYDIIDMAVSLMKAGVRAHFVLAGAGSEEDERNIREKIEANGVADMIELPGWIRGDEKSRRLMEADIFLLPSYNECMPMSILDACGYGLPVVASNVGGIPNLVRNNESGILCTPGNVGEFAEALKQLINAPGLMQNMGQASLEMAMEKYSLDAHINMIEKLWDELV